MSNGPVAFLSYVRADDQHESGRLTQFRERLAGEVRMQTGEPFDIFQDRNDIAWGQQWKSRIEDSLDSVTFLIPVLTPSFFKSPPCRDELERFLQRERRLDRADLILPLYYVECDILHDRDAQGADSLAQLIAGRQYVDWRELRFEPLTVPEVGRGIARMARQIAEVLRRTKPAPLKLEAAEPAGRMDATQPPAPSELASALPVMDPVLGLAHKTQAPVLVVDAFHGGDYATLAKAIEAAKPGTLILVRPGLYKEGVVISKPVEIVGDGDPGDIVIEAIGKNTICFQASMGRVSNLTLRQGGGEGIWHCVHITQGRLDLEACDISSKGGACVAISNGADPRVRRNRIHDGKQSGIFIYAGGQGTLEDNEVFANTLSGVEIKTGGTPTLRGNRIYGGKQGGVFVYENGLGVLEDNEIFSNALGGVLIKSEGNPTLRRNRIHDGALGGVHVREHGMGILEENDIFANALAGVSISSGGNPILRRNRIFHGKQGGVLVYEGGIGVLEDNDISANAFSGVEIKEEGNPVLRRNRIRDGKGHGVYVYSNGRGTFENNKISANAYSGVLIKSGGSPELRGNQISGNKSEAIRVLDEGGGCFEKNDLRKNGKGAWRIDASSEANVKRSGNIE